VKLWSGRFAAATDRRVDDFHSSIAFDSRLYRYDIRGSQAHARALARAGIITGEEAKAIIEGLEGLLMDIEAGKVEFSKEAEDIHMNIEALLTARIGTAGAKLHTARSRNDQVALDTRMYLRHELGVIESLLAGLQTACLELAGRAGMAVMPGYTHLQPAQPILFAHHLLAYVEMLQRDRERLADCFKRVNVCPLGSGALAGVPYPLDRQAVAKELGFAGITRNSLDAVSDRDYILEFMAAAAIMMMHISRLCEDVVLWATAEFGFVELDDAFSTGSSIMPQKKNPDVAELARGKSGRVFGHLLGLLSVMKGLPLAYNKDMQEDKEALFDTVDTCKAVLTIMAPMISTLQVNRERMEKACRRGFLTATDLADYLVRKGLPFRKAHELTGRVVRKCIEQNKTLEELTLPEWQELLPMVDEEVLRAVTLHGATAARKLPGGTAPETVAAAVAESRKTVLIRLVPDHD